MKNMKMSMKLIVGFTIVIIVAIVVAAIGVIGMSKINAADDALYHENVVAFQALGDIRSAYLNVRIQLRNLVIFDYGTADYNKSISAIETCKQEMQEHIKVYEATITDEIDTANFNNFKNAYDEFIEMVSDTDRAVAAGNMDEAMNLVFNVGVDISDRATNTLLECVTYNDGIASAAVNSNTELFKNMLIIQVVVLAACIIIVVFLVRYMAGLISVPLRVLTEFMKVAGSTGNITLRPEDIKNIERFAQAKDETGQCIASTASFLKHVTDIADELGSVANGDLTTYIHVLSDEDVLGMAVQKMVDNLNNMFGEINASTAQVSVGSKQIADGSQVLAQGSTEQASAVEQLSSSIAEIAQKTKTNAETAEKAAKLAEIIKGNAEKGSRQMDEMVSAVKEINQASQSINRVIKVIDDIAFQTNILALNAAVEAARAGQHGKGFAVVAEEVRNLAAKSAEAAKDTGGLISNSIEKAELGARIADETATSLTDIVTGINESSQLVGSIARSSDEQAEGISQINKGIDQVAQVIQQNSATAEESAAASEEMSGQASMLESLIAQFKLKGGGSAERLQSSYSAEKGPQKRLIMPAKTSQIPNDDNSGEFGKY